MNKDILLRNAIEGFFLSRRADGYSSDTLLQYEWGLKFLTDRVDNPKLVDLKTIDIRRLLGDLNKSKLSGTSVFHVWKTIRAFYKWASVELDIERPDLVIKPPPHRYKPVIPFTIDEIKLLLKATEHTAVAHGDQRDGVSYDRPTGRRDKAIVFTLLDTGIRAGELSRLERSDVDMNSGVIQIRPYKSGIKSKPRTIPIGTGTRKIIWRYLTERDDKYQPVFATKNGDVVTTENLLLLIRRLGIRAGVVGAHPHRFRHTFAITFLRNGGDVFTLQRLLGHSSLEIVRHYLNLADADDASAHRRASPVDNWKL